MLRGSARAPQKYIYIYIYAIAGIVWVRGLRGNALGHVDCDRVVHETIVAVTVLLRAIIQLLLREVYQTLVSPTLDESM